MKHILPLAFFVSISPLSFCSAAEAAPAQELQKMMTASQVILHNLTTHPTELTHIRPALLAGLPQATTTASRARRRALINDLCSVFTRAASGENHAALLVELRNILAPIYGVPLEEKA